MLTDSPVAKLQVCIEAEDRNRGYRPKKERNRRAYQCGVRLQDTRLQEKAGLRERAADRLRGWRIVQCGILWRRESR